MYRLTTLSFVLFMTSHLLSCSQKPAAYTLDWKIAGKLPSSPGQQHPLGFAGPVAGVHNNVLIVAGGANFPDSMPWMNGKKKYYDDIFIYTRNSSGMVLTKKSFKLPSTIAYSANCSTTHGIFYAGGESEHGISARAWLIKWDDHDSSIILNSLPDLPIAITNAMATVDRNKVYIAGGETLSGVLDGFYCLDLKNPSSGWTQLPVVPKPVSHAVLLTQSNGVSSCIYLVGGRKKNKSGISSLYNTVYEFNLQEKNWSQKKSLPYNLSAGTGIAAGSNHLLLFGGDQGEIFREVETCIAAINKEESEPIKQLLIQKKIQLQSSHPGFSHEVLLYNTINDEWKAIDSIPFETPVTTTAVKWGEDLIIPSGEIRAGVRTPRILSVRSPW